jgi:putative nucleotidyltransferase with HDIG domain
MSAAGFHPLGDDRIVPVTLSCGLATYPADSTNRHELMTIADANLYRAKNSEAGVQNTSAEQRANRALRTDDTFSLFDALVTSVDNKDRYTRQHSEDVAEYSVWIAEEMNLSEETMRVIRVGALLHDVGKIGVPDEILRKPGRLTDEEFVVMQRHPVLGAMLVGAVPGMEAILDVVRSHHERWDGKGYPDNLAGEDIPLLGRITAVADAVSAMTTTRPYRKEMDWKVAMDQVKAGSGTQFDPAAASAFLRAAARRRPDTDAPRQNQQEEPPSAAPASLTAAASFVAANSRRRQAAA